MMPQTALMIVYRLAASIASCALLLASDASAQLRPSVTPAGPATMLVPTVTPQPGNIAVPTLSSLQQQVTTLQGLVTSLQQQVAALQAVSLPVQHQGVNYVISVPAALMIHSAAGTWITGPNVTVQADMNLNLQGAMTLVNGGGRPAARLGDQTSPLTCAGPGPVVCPPATLVGGSPTFLIP
jgi:hypothetical protein